MTNRRSEVRTSSEATAPIYQRGSRAVPDGTARAGDVWVLAGQSNMQGCAEPGPQQTAHPEVSMLSFDRTWKPAVEPVHRFWETKESAQYKMSPYLGYEISKEELDKQFEEVHPQDELSPVGGWGPGYAFGLEMRRLTGVPIGLLPVALGGSPLDMWAKDFGERKGERFEDTLYGDLLERVEIAGGGVRGVLWYQGESDAHGDLAPTYIERFERFVNDLRQDVGDPDLPFITVQLATSDNMDWAGADNWNLMRENQRQASEKLHNVEMIAAADLPRIDGIHLSFAAYERLGPRLARAASKYVPETSGRYRVSRLGSLELVESGSALRIRFDGVNGALHSAAGLDLSKSFQVEGVDVLGAELDQPDGVVLRLSSSVSAGANVWHGRGFEPQVGLLDEADFLMPLFGPVPAPALD